MEAPGASVVEGQVTASSGSDTATPVIGTLPLLVTVNEYEIVSPASVIPEWFTSTGAAAVLSIVRRGVGEAVGVHTEGGRDVVDRAGRDVVDRHGVGDGAARRAGAGRERGRRAGERCG